MTQIEIIPGGSYSDNTPAGAFVDLLWDSHLETSGSGRVELPPIPRPNGEAGRNVLHLRLAGDGVRFCGTGHEGSVKDRAQEWDGIQWVDHGVAHGLNACIYKADGTLVVARPGPENWTGATGFRQIADAAITVGTRDGLVSCESTTADPARHIWEYSTFGDLTVGQGGAGIYGEDPVIALYAGRRILIAQGMCRFIHFRRWTVGGVDTMSLAWVQEGGCGRLIMPVAELLQWPLAHDLDPQPPKLEQPGRPLWFGCFNFGNPDTLHLASEGPGNCYLAVRNIAGTPLRPVVTSTEE